MQAHLEYLNDIELTLFPPLDNFITWYKISEDQLTVERESFPINDSLFQKIYDGIEKLRLLPRNIGLKVSDLKLFNLDELKESFSCKGGINSEISFKELSETEVVTFEALYHRAQHFLLALADPQWPGFPYIDYNYGNEHKKELFRYFDLEEKLKAYNEVKAYFKNLQNLNESYELREIDDTHNIRCLEFEILYDHRLLAICTVRFGNTMRIRLVDSDISKGKVSMSIDSKCTQNGPVYGLNISRRLTGKNEFISLTEMEVFFNNIFLPQVDDKVFKQIHNAFEAVYEIDLGRDDIRWDPVRDCFHLAPDLESSLFQYFIPHPTEKKEICKYTSLSTLVEIIKSKKIRMNGILAMNDMSEYQYLKDCSRNFKNEEDEEFYYLGNKKFITSFSKKIDYLGMWRLYGNNLEGICMVFDVNNASVKDIIYIPDNSTEVMKVEQLLEILNRNPKINFRICIIDNNQAFYKSNEYEVEDESRLLINSEKPDGWQVYSNNLLTPYIQPSLFPQTSTPDGKSSNYDKPFGLILKKILVGPNMPNREYNCSQLLQLLRENKMYEVEVECSTKHKFR